MNSSESKVNIVAMGISGTGKSSLLNYLLGKKYFKTGVGRPVTGVGFYKKDSIIKGVPVTIIDSYGIEAGSNFDVWGKECNDLLKEHGIEQPIKEWLHVVIYCVSAEDGRVQPIDIETIHSFRSSGQKVIIAITHADYSEENCRILRDSLLEECPEIKDADIIEIDSIRGKQYGEQDIYQKIIAQFFNNVFSNLPKRCIFLAEQEIERFYSETLTEITNLSYSWGTSSKHEEWLEDKCNSFSEDFNKRICPNIFKSLVLECIQIAKGISTIVSSSIIEINPVFNFDKLKVGNQDEELTLLEKIALAALLPAVISFGLFWETFLAEEDVKKELKENLKNFCDDKKKQVQNTDKFQKEIKEIKNQLFTALHISCD